MERFRGLKLSNEDRRHLRNLQAGGKPMAARTWRRIRVLELLDQGLSIRSAAAAVGQYPREVGRVGKRYLWGGVQAALSDDPRPKPERKLDSSQEAAIVALVCGPPPTGRARWTVRLAAEQAVRRGIVDDIG